VIHHFRNKSCAQNLRSDEVTRLVGGSQEEIVKKTFSITQRVFRILLRLLITLVLWVYLKGFMRSFLPIRWLFVIGFWPLALLCLDGSRANASCGDYVHIVSNPTSDSNNHTPTPTPPCGCVGSSCQKSPAIPTVPAPDTTKSQSQNSDAILPVDVTIDSKTVTNRFEFLVRTCSAPVETIFHPPRRS
jgi:hypothetical protein